jgi:hypothetical protein
MCNDTLYAVELDLCDFNIPGIVEIKYTLRNWIDAFPALLDYDANPTTVEAITLDGNITFNTTDFANAQWFDLQVEVDRNGFTTTPVGRPVKYYTTALAGYVPTASRKNTWALHKAGKSDLVVAVKNRKGEWRIIGDKDNSCTLIANFDTGQAPGDENAGFTLDGLWSAHGTPCPFYDGTF